MTLRQRLMKALEHYYFTENEQHRPSLSIGYVPALAVSLHWVCARTSSVSPLGMCPH